MTQMVKGEEQDGDEGEQEVEKSMLGAPTTSRFRDASTIKALRKHYDRAEFGTFSDCPATVRQCGVPSLWTVRRLFRTDPLSSPAGWVGMTDLRSLIKFYQGQVPMSFDVIEHVETVVELSVMP
ncbi:hypothetical protein UVI_02017430 [Ustilaginoidea virens]|uniref:Uncharacterized protein n=1 Tax=Ustilaginoidea virens TaxID=1159556 RepID=A0A1B5KUG6_USTVR|nr:hypothetical protein UVI_02017430 [Ustilaginoidea virens]